MKMKKLKRFVSFIFIVNMLITMPFAASAIPPQGSKRHYRRYSESCKDKMRLDETTDNKRMEEYRKKGYEDGFNNVLVKPFVPRRYRKAYEEEYKRGQEGYRKKIQGTEQKTDKSDIKINIINEKENVTENKIYNDINNKEKETDDKKFEEYRKKGYEDGFNNVLVKPFVPRRYRKVYEEEYKRGQDEYKKKSQETEQKTDKSDIKINIINEKENVADNQTHNDVVGKEQKIYDKRMEEYKKKGYENGVNNVEIKSNIPRTYKKAYEEEYKRGQDEYKNNVIGQFGYEDGIKNRNVMENLKKMPGAYKVVYEREYIKGLLIYIKENLHSLIIDFGKDLPTTEEKAKELGIIHGLNNYQYRTGAPENIQKEYSQSYFLAQKARLKDQGYHDAIKNMNKKTLKKTFIIRLYEKWYNKGLKRGKEEYMKKVEALKKQGYIDGLKKHVMTKDIPEEFELIYKTEYERGREKYIKKVMEKYRKHLLKIKMKYGI